MLSLDCVGGNWPDWLPRVWHQPFISSSLEKVSTVRDASREQWCHDISICRLNSWLWKLTPCPGAQTDYLSLEDQWGDSCKPSPEEKDENIHPGWKKTDTNLCVLFACLPNNPLFSEFKPLTLWSQNTTIALSSCKPNIWEQQVNHVSLG